MLQCIFNFKHVIKGHDRTNCPSLTYIICNQVFSRCFNICRNVLRISNADYAYNIKIISCIASVKWNATPLLWAWGRLFLQRFIVSNLKVQICLKPESCEGGNKDSYFKKGTSKWCIKIKSRQESGVLVFVYFKFIWRLK